VTNVNDVMNRSFSSSRATKTIAGLPSTSLTDQAADKSLWFWTYRNPVHTLIVALVMLDWVPNLIGIKLGFEADTFTGTKFFVVPMFLAVVIPLLRSSRNAYTRTSAWFGVFAVIIGIVPAVRSGDAPLGKLLSYMVSALVVVYFQQVGSLSDCRAILRLCVYLTVGDGITQFLAAMGYLPVLSNENLLQAGRVFAASNTATVGFIPLIAAATFGGLILTQHRQRGGYLVPLVAFITLIAGAYAILAAAQRSSSIAFLMALVPALWYYVKNGGRRASAYMGVIMLLFVGFVFAERSQLAELISVTEFRFTEGAGHDNVEYAKDARMEGLRMFLYELVTEPRLCGQSVEDFAERSGVGDHSVPAEAYFSGGVVLLLTLLAGLYKVFNNLLHTLLRGRTAADRAMAVSLLILGCVSAFHFMIQTGLLIRAVDMLLGLCLSPAWQDELRATRTSPVARVQP
jgi:hypothetical protein